MLVYGVSRIPGLFTIVRETRISADFLTVLLEIKLPP